MEINYYVKKLTLKNKDNRNQNFMKYNYHV